jgi:hypothetical protein
MSIYASESLGGPRNDPQGDPYEADQDDMRGVVDGLVPRLTRRGEKEVDLLGRDARRRVQEELAAQYGRQQDPNSVIYNWQEQLRQQAADKARPMRNDEDPSDELMRSTAFAASMQDTPQENLLPNWALAVYVVVVVAGIIGLILISINWSSASNDSKYAAISVAVLAIVAVLSYVWSDYKFKPFA